MIDFFGSQPHLCDPQWQEVSCLSASFQSILEFSHQPLRCMRQPRNTVVTRHVETCTFLYIAFSHLQVIVSCVGPVCVDCVVALSVGFVINESVVSGVAYTARQVQIFSWIVRLLKCFIELTSKSWLDLFVSGQDFPWPVSAFWISGKWAR